MTDTRPDESELREMAREHCDRHGHILGREADTNATIPICERCGTDLEAEDEERARMMPPAGSVWSDCDNCRLPGWCVPWETDPIDGRPLSWIHAGSCCGEDDDETGETA